MRCAEPLCGLDQDGDTGAPIVALIRSPVLERCSIDVFDRDEQILALQDHIMNPYDVGVPESGQCLRLAKESLASAFPQGLRVVLEP